MDESSLKLAIQQRLRNNGVYNDIAAQVRSSLLVSLSNPSEKKAKHHGIEDVALQSLVYHFLNEKQFLHTLSVFAAECGLENGSISKFSVDESLKVLGLGSLCKQCKSGMSEGDISSLLITAAQMISSRPMAATAERQTVTVSVQTESSHQAKSTENNEIIHTIYNGTQPSNSFDDRLQQIERELRHEMNEKLKISAKKQAMNATRRVEEKHRNEINALRETIELARERARAIEKDWAENHAREQHLMEKERIDMNKRCERLLLEKETLESEVALMAEQKRQHQRDCGKQQDNLEQQKRSLQSEINKVILQQDVIKATELMCASLQDEKEELLNETRLLRKQLASVHQSRDTLHQTCAQLKAEQVKNSQEHRIKENLLQRDKAQLESQLAELQEKNQAASSELEKTRLRLERSTSEVSSLRSLLRQSQDALESVTFRDDDPRYNTHRHLSRGSFGGTWVTLPSTPVARPKTTSYSSKQHSPAPSSLVPSFDSRAFGEQQDEGVQPVGTADKHCEEDTGNKVKIGGASILTAPKDPPLWSPLDPPDRSIAELPLDRIELDSRELFRSTKSELPLHQTTKKWQSPIQSIVNDQADDISAISEVVSRYNYADEVSHLKIENNGKAHCDEAEALQVAEKNDASTRDKDGRSLSEKENEPNDENTDMNIAASIPNSSVIASVVSAPNTTVYSESFHSEIEKAKGSHAVRSEGLATEDDLVSIRSNDSERIAPRTLDTPRTTSSQSDDGYTCSFCTEE